MRGASQRIRRHASSPGETPAIDIFHRDEGTGNYGEGVFVRNRGKVWFKDGKGILCLGGRGEGKGRGSEIKHTWVINLRLGGRWRTLGRSFRAVTRREQQLILLRKRNEKKEEVGLSSLKKRVWK